MLNGTERKQFIPQGALQVSYRVHPEISAENYIWTIQGVYSRYSKAAMYVQRRGDTVMLPYTPRHNGKAERSHRKDNEGGTSRTPFTHSRILRCSLPDETGSITASLCALWAGSLPMRLFLSCVTYV